MRLPPISGRVKFRSRFGFRLHDPPFIEGGAELPVRLTAEVYQSEDTEGHQEPTPTGQQPGDQTVAPPDGVLPFLLESIHLETRGREHRHLEVVAGHEPGHKGAERPRGIPPGKLGYRRDDDNVEGIDDDRG